MPVQNDMHVCVQYDMYVCVCSERYVRVPVRNDTYLCVFRTICTCACSERHVPMYVQNDMYVCVFRTTCTSVCLERHVLVCVQNDMYVCLFRTRKVEETMRRQCFSFAGTFTASYSESLVVDTTYTLPLNAEKESVLNLPWNTWYIDGLIRADLSVPSDRQMSFSQLTPAYRHTSLDNTAGCVSTIVRETKRVSVLFFKTVIKRLRSV